MSFYTSKTLTPGQPGTKRWLKKYGDDLVCVRYKYDAVNKRKIKTVELVVETEEWQIDKTRIPANKIVGVRILYGEKALGKLVRSAGGRWDRNKQLWQIPYREAVNLGLEDRIMEK